MPPSFQKVPRSVCEVGNFSSPFALGIAPNGIKLGFRMVPAVHTLSYSCRSSFTVRVSHIVLAAT
jgi:hypothetical protein